MNPDCIFDAFDLPAQPSFDGLDDVCPWDLIAFNDYSVTSGASLLADDGSDAGGDASILSELRSVVAEQEELKRRQDTLKAKQEWLQRQIGSASLVIEESTGGLLEWSEGVLQEGTGPWWEVTDPHLSPFYRAYREEAGPSAATASLSESRGLSSVRNQRRGEWRHAQVWRNIWVKSFGMLRLHACPSLACPPL